MTRKTFIILCINSIILLGCDDNNNDRDNIIKLEQTSWGGEMITTTNGVDEVYKAGIAFYNSSSGSYELQSVGTENPLIKDDFNYKIDKKMLQIEGNPFLKGHWFIVSYDEENLVLEQGTGGDIEKRTLTLYREN